MQKTLLLNRVASLFQPLLLAQCVVPVFLLTGCAGITVTPLDAKGQRASKQQEGLRYYMPKPYLLVVQLPPTVSTNSENHGGGDVRELLPGDDKSKSSSTNATDSASSQPGSVPVSDTSFMAASPFYQVKLIYLPDLEHPMAMTESTGLFGTSSMKPALQDGWMLTSLDASADSKVSETLAAVGSIVGGAVGTGAAAAKTGAKAAATTNFLPLYQQEGSPILRPGLYSFDYDSETGKLKGILPVTVFEKLPYPR